MGFFDDILSKVTEVTGMGQDVVDNVSQAAGDVTSQAQEHISGVTEELPQDPTEVANQVFGDNNEQK